MPFKKNKIVIAVSLALSLSQNNTFAQFDPLVELSDLNGQNGFTFNGLASFDELGISVSGAGDVNGDGIDDLIIGAEGSDSNGNGGTGSSYVIFGSDAGIPHPFDLSTLDGTNGFTINGEASSDYSGNSVSAAGDINGDGIDDLIIGAESADPNGISGAGSSYVVFGSDTGLNHPFNLSALNGTNGFALNGEGLVDSSGVSVSNAGDINGDGIDDLVIGAFYAGININDRSGKSYVVFGSDTGIPHPFDLSALDGNNGITINGVAIGDHSGVSVSGAGDFNGDGVDDFIIGADYSDPNNNDRAGSSYLIFGSDTGFAHPLNLSALDATTGITFNGVAEGDRSGRSVSGAGDVNGDGIDDLIIGASRAENNAGSSYVVFGSTTGLLSPFNLSTLDGLNGFTINGIMTFDNLGSAVSGAGDVNGDGIDDLIIGAYGASPNSNISAGSSYVVFGSDTGLPHPFNLSTVDGTNGFILNGVATSDFSGNSVSSAGDINGDGLIDVVIGANEASPNGNTRAGSSYVIFGNDRIFKNGLE